MSGRIGIMCFDPVLLVLLRDNIQSRTADIIQLLGQYDRLHVSGKSCLSQRLGNAKQKRPHPI